jgi:transposase InsO family protein
VPLVERKIVDIREEMVLRALDARYTLFEVAAEFGVSIPTVRLWRDRYRAYGRSGLSDRSHAPHSSPLRTDPAVEALIVEDRRRFKWGSKKILRRLRDEHPEIELPARSTVDGILARNGLVEHSKPPRQAARSPFIRRYTASAPGELMTLDHKGQFRLRNGQYCFPLTICDSFSRYVMACQALPSTSLNHAWPVIVRLFREYGLPLAAQSDNGPPFGCTSGKFSTMSVRFMSLGIQPIFSRPGRPGDNGRHERMHRDLKREATRPSATTMRAQQCHFDSFRTMYNLERPHEGIAMARPASLFCGTDRPYPKRVPKPEYDLHLEKRKVTDAGSINWRNQAIFISEALRGQTVGLEPVAGATLNLHFYGFILGKIDEDKARFI